MRRSRTSATDRRLDGRDRVERGEPLVVSVDGVEVPAHRGETVADVLMAAGRRTFRETARRGAGRGLFCGMGVCYDCLVVVDGRASTRACTTAVEAGMRVDTQREWGR